MRKAVAELEERGDANSLAAAGAILQFTHADPSSSLALLTRAVSIAPERADLEWFEIQFCGHTPVCDPEPMEARLRVLDPANGAPLMNALNRATRSGDARASLLLLSELARTERVDFYWTKRIVALTRALADTHQLSLREALVDVVGVLVAEEIPLGPSASICKGERLKIAKVLEDCRAVAETLQRSDTNLTEMIGSTIATHAWPVDAPQYKAAIEARRTYEYRSKTLIRSIPHQFNSRQWAEEYLAFCVQHEREQDVDGAELVAEGRSPNPPSGWTP